MSLWQALSSTIFNFYFFNFFRLRIKIAHVFTIIGWNADLEAMQLQVQAKEAVHTERVLAHQMALTNKLRAVENRCEAMKQAEVQMRLKNEAERQQFEREKKIVIHLV